jgi:light-regulated signal transduction histidine kinase (bacteriophytochrome)
MKENNDNNALDNLIEGFQIISFDWRYVYVNKTVIKQGKHLSKDDLLGYTMMEKYPGIEKSELFKTMQQCMEERIHKNIENEFTFPDNSKGWFELRIHPVAEGIGILSMDISERKISELKMIKYTHLLELKNTQLNDFCNIVSHNLRGPIVNLSMLADFIEHKKDSDKREEMFMKIKPVVNSLHETFNELVSSLQVREELEVALEEVVFKDSVEKILEGYKDEIESSQAEIEMNFTAAPAILYSQKYINSILYNLISNAFKYRSLNKKPKIKIKTEIINDNVILSICDNGLGLDTKLHQHNLFKMRQVFHDHPDARGFGLFMTKNHVEAMDGKIWVDSAPEKGATFFVKFNTSNNPNI